MLIYCFCIIFNILLYYLLKKFKGGKIVYFNAVLLYLMIIAALRKSNIGADYPTYVNVFEHIRAFFSFYPMEKGFLLFNYLVSMISDNYVVFSFVTETIFFLCFRKYIIENVSQDDFFWVLFIFIANPYFYIQSSFNVIRQTFAIAIVLVAIKYLLEKKWIYYFILIIIAAQFHKMTYIFSLLPLIQKVEWTRKKIIIITFFSMFVNVVINNDRVIATFASLFGYGAYIGFGETEFNFRLYVLFVVAVQIYFLISYSQFFDNQREKFFVDVYLISLAFLPMFVMNDIAYRIYVGLGIISLPAIPLIIRAYRRKKGKQVIEYYIVCGFYVIYYLTLITVFLYKMGVNKNTAYVPFKFFWQ